MTTTTPPTDAPAGSPLDLTGEQHVIEHGPYRAVVTELGGALRTLTHEGRDLVVGWPGGEPPRLYRGALLAPWPNRVRDGRYSWAGAEQQLAVSEPDRGAALHGLVAGLGWVLRERDASSLVLGVRLFPQPGYPHLLDLEVRYALDDDGLSWSLQARNAGAETAPYGCSIHPYLVAGPGGVDDWTFRLGAEEVLGVDPERLLPLPGPGAGRVAPVAGTDLDLRTERSLRGLSVDHAFTGVVGERKAVLRAADGSGVRLTWGEGLPWVQVHTADRPDPEDDRVGLAVEPMTCPPDALRTGVDLVELAPGAVHRAHWRLAALTV